MFKPKYPSYIFTTALFGLFIFTSICWSETTGRSVLEMARKKKGATDKPAYVNRLKDSQKSTTTDANSQKKADSFDTQIEPLQILDEEIEDINELAVETNSLEALKKPVAAAGKSEKKPIADKLLQMLPAESIFVVRANHLEYNANKMDQFLTDVSPLPTGVSTMVRTQLAELLGDPELKTVKMGGDFAIFGLEANEKISDTNSTNIFIGFLIPVTSYKKFTSENPYIGKPDSREISKIQREGKPELFVTRVGQYALITTLNNSRMLVETAKSMSESGAKGLADILNETQVRQAGNEPFWAYGNVQLASKIFGSAISDGLSQMKKAARETEQNGLAPTPYIQQQLNAQMLLFDTLMKETKSVTIALRPKLTNLNIVATVSAVPDTNMAKILTVTSQPQGNKLLGYMEDDAMMNFACSFDQEFMKTFATKSFEMMTFITGQQMAAKDAENIKIMITELVGSLGQTNVCSVKIDAKNQPPFSTKYVFEVKDVNNLSEATDKIAEVINSPSFADMYKQMGIKTNLAIKRGSDNYEGTSIDSAKFAMIPTEPNSAHGKMMSIMYGDGFDYKWAVVDKLWVCASGKNADTDLRELIDAVKQGGSKPTFSQVKTALAQLSDSKSANFIGTFNFVREMQSLLPIMRQAESTSRANADTPARTLPDISNVPINTCGIAFAGKLDNGQLTLDVAISKEHLGEITSFIRTINPQAMPKEKQPEWESVNPPVQEENPEQD